MCAVAAVPHRGGRRGQRRAPQCCVQGALRRLSPLQLPDHGLLGAAWLCQSLAEHRRCQPTLQPLPEASALPIRYSRYTNGFCGGQSGQTRPVARFVCHARVMHAKLSAPTAR